MHLESQDYSTSKAERGENNGFERIGNVAVVIKSEVSFWYSRKN